jgi:hypothetical protein
MAPAHAVSAEEAELHGDAEVVAVGPVLDDLAVGHAEPVRLGGGERAPPGRRAVDDERTAGRVLGVPAGVDAAHRRVQGDEAPSATASWTSHRRSENIPRSHSAVAYQPAGPGSRQAGGSVAASRLCASGATRRAKSSKVPFAMEASWARASERAVAGWVVGVVMSTSLRLGAGAGSVPTTELA